MLAMYGSTMKAKHGIVFVNHIREVLRNAVV